MTDRLFDEYGRTLARSILGTDDEDAFLTDVTAFCNRHLESEVVETLFCDVSIGVVVGVLLHDGRRVVMKVHGPRKAPEYLGATRRVQQHLHERGFPAPRPLVGPEPFRIGHAVVDEHVAGGQEADPHRPAVRREMAATLARLVTLGTPVGDDLLTQRKWPPLSHGLWPPPHDPHFDFQATAGGAEWIDRFAERARAGGSEIAGEPVVGHVDWRAGNMRFRDGRVHVVFDWDSLALDQETAIVGGAAGGFPLAGSLPIPRVPEPEEVAGFVDDYESACPRPFSTLERRAIGAAGVYQMAYTSRCEHSVDVSGNELAGSFREALRLYGDEYLRS